MNIKPLSELRHYTTLLKEVKDNEPLYLTKNGRGCYVIMTMEDYEKLNKAALKNEKSNP